VLKSKFAGGRILWQYEGALFKWTYRNSWLSFFSPPCKWIWHHVIKSSGYLKTRRFGNYLCPHYQVKPMRTFAETSCFLSILTRLITLQDFITSCRRENFKSQNMIPAAWGSGQYKVNPFLTIISCRWEFSFTLRPTCLLLSTRSKGRWLQEQPGHGSEDGHIFLLKH
jgi:hypothetical protein